MLFLRNSKKCCYWTVLIVLSMLDHPRHHREHCGHAETCNTRPRTMSRHPGCILLAPHAASGVGQACAAPSISTICDHKCLKIHGLGSCWPVPMVFLLHRLEKSSRRPVRPREPRQRRLMVYCKSLHAHSVPCGAWDGPVSIIRRILVSSSISLDFSKKALTKYILKKDMPILIHI